MSQSHREGKYYKLTIVNEKIKDKLVYGYGEIENGRNNKDPVSGRYKGLQSREQCSVSLCYKGPGTLVILLGSNRKASLCPLKGHSVK